MSNILDEHKHYLKFLKCQNEKQQVEGLNKSLRLKIIGKRVYKALIKELGLTNEIMMKYGESSI